MTREERADLRRLVADYISTEGCSCCQDRERHAAAAAALGKALRVPMYADRSGYDFARSRTVVISPSERKAVKRGK